MLEKFKNGIKIEFSLETQSPLIIKSSDNILDMSLPDASCIRSQYNGEQVPIIPGSTLKGVFRTHYEWLTSCFEGKCCDIFDENCSGIIGKNIKEAEKIYNKMCSACKLFGSTAIASRIRFLDAYPNENIVLGVRNGVAINRITGGAERNALYDFEVVEKGTFKTEILLRNYELYQLVLILYILRDINDGYVVFGSSTSSGNGRLKVKDLQLTIREYRKDIKKLTGYYGESSIDIDYNNKYFYSEGVLEAKSVEDLLDALKSVEIKNKVKRDSKNVV